MHTWFKLPAAECAPLGPHAGRYRIGSRDGVQFKDGAIYVILEKS